MNKRMQRDFKETPLVTESLKLLTVNTGAEFLLGKPIKVSWVYKHNFISDYIKTSLLQ